MTSPPAESVLVRIADLHPTQVTVGFREVAEKRLRWRSRLRNAGSTGRPRLVAPIVLGPAGELYLIDRHHLACALMAEGLNEVHVRQVADFSALAPRGTWQALEARGWCHPYDADGQRRPFTEIPTSIDALRDDPFRSLAGALRRAGGFVKKGAPFSEFAWADFLRLRISGDALAMDFDGALARALVLARLPAARHLPGWLAAPDSGVGTVVGAIASPHAYR